MSGQSSWSDPLGPRTHKGLVIADDLTGAMDTGHAFAANGYRTTIVGHEATVETNHDLLVIDTDSRTDPSDRARETVADVVDAYTASLVYKKIDSTLRGNVADETEAALDAVGPGIAVVAPAFPTNGRVTIGGYHLADWEPVDTDANNPKCPRESLPPTANLVDLFSETVHSIEHLPVDVVAEGATAVCDRLRSIGRSHEYAIVVCDAVSTAHLDAVASASATLDPALYVGSAGLAEHVMVPGEPTLGNDVLGVVGSTNERTVKQLAAIPAEQVVEIDCRAALHSPQDTGRKAAARAVETFTTTDFVIVSSVGSMAPEKLYAIGADSAGIDREAVQQRVETALLTAVGTCWREYSPDALFATGGTIAKGVLDELGVRRVELTGRTIEAGIPVARFQLGDDAPTPLVTKAGGFGGSDAIRRCLGALRSS